MESSRIVSFLLFSCHLHLSFNLALTTTIHKNFYKQTRQWNSKNNLHPYLLLLDTRALYSDNGSLFPWLLWRSLGRLCYWLKIFFFTTLAMGHCRQSILSFPSLLGAWLMRLVLANDRGIEPKMWAFQKETFSLPSYTPVLSPTVTVDAHSHCFSTTLSPKIKNT